MSVKHVNSAEPPNVNFEAKQKKVTAMMALKKIWKSSRKGQSLLEYAMVAALVSAAVIAMSTYVFRSVQSAQQTIHEEFRNE